MDYCKRNHVTFSTEKTKLLAYFSKSSESQVYYDKIISPINIDNLKIEFPTEAEHVGVTRTIQPEGNLARILNHFTAHQRALAAVAPSGLGKRRRGNPAATIGNQQLLGNPALLSGIASLLLKKTEIDIMDQHRKKTIQHLQKNNQKARIYTPHTCW